MDYREEERGISTESLVCLQAESLELISILNKRLATVTVEAGLAESVPKAAQSEAMYNARLINERLNELINRINL